MPKRRTSSPESVPPVTPERAHRLFRLINHLGKKPQTRNFLTTKLRIGVRDFYRDLDLLRKTGIVISYEKNKYSLITPFAEAQTLVPFPNPCITIGEAEQLAKGKKPAHEKIKHLLSRIQAPRFYPPKK